MSLGSDSKSDHIVMERSEVQKRFASHVQQKVLRAKVVVVGNATTGKTTLLRLFNGENFDAKHYKMTARTEIIVSKRLPVSESTQVEFIFYDSGGAQIFNFTQEQSQYWSDANFVVLVYDVSDKVSFATCSAWYTQVKRANNNKKLKGLLVANKSDLDDSMGEVDAEEAHAWADKMGLQYIKTNYHDPGNFVKALETLAQDYSKQFKSFTDTVRANVM